MHLHRIELRYVDCCTPDYIIDGSGILLGVPVDKASTWADLKQDLNKQLDHSDMIAPADFDECKAAVDRWFNATCKPNASEETLCAPHLDYHFEDIEATGMGECSSMWFRFLGASFHA